ncbi:tubby-like F-box protein 7 [Tanacetum coccineum]
MTSSLRSSFSLRKLTTSRSKSHHHHHQQQQVFNNNDGVIKTRDDVIKTGENDEGRWSSMLPELIGEIIKRVEESDDTWPMRRNVVVCGCVCKKWRDVVKMIVKPPGFNRGIITFPSCLKQIQNVENLLLNIHNTIVYGAWSAWVDLEESDEI